MRRLFARIIWRFRGVQVYALVGKSGTGKSFRARLVMEKYAIELLIDDGLLIRDQQIIAGKSAKREANYMAAVRTALFTDRTHLRQVRSAIERQKFKRVLIVGTSDRMVQRIAVTLQLPQPAKVIRIEDVATAEEIRTAITHRTAHGRHVIPAPAIEVHRNYPRIMGDSIRVFWKRGVGLLRRDKSYEKTVVRPAFSSRGSVTISEGALTQMIMHCVAEEAPDVAITRVSFSTDHRGYRIEVHVRVPFRREMSGSLYRLQQFITERVERFTGITIDELNVVIDHVDDAPYNSDKRHGGR